MRLPTAGLLLLAFTGTTATEPGCGPQCRGTCFGGTCLFAADDLDYEDSLKEQRFQTGQHAAMRWPRLHEEHAQRYGLTEGFLHKSAPMGAPLAVPAAASADVPVDLLSVGQAQQRQASPLPDSFLGREAQRLMTELGKVEAREARLEAENGELRQELEDWRAAGEKIAQREAKVVSILGHGPPSLLQPEGPAKVSEAAPTSMLARGSTESATDAAVSVAMATLVQAARHVLPSSLAPEGLVVLPLVVCTILLSVAIWCTWAIWCYSRRVAKGERIDWRGGVAQVLSFGGRGHRMDPVLRYAGFVPYMVQISEIHLGSLFAGSNDVRVCFRTGMGAHTSTQALPSNDGSFLRFKDTLPLEIRSADPPCKLSVMDRRGELASVVLQAKELIHLACRPHQEYFRTELQPTRAFNDEMGGGRRPYVAMRIRDATGVPPTGGGAH